MKKAIPFALLMVLLAGCAPSSVSAPSPKKEDVDVAKTAETSGEVFETQTAYRQVEPEEAAAMMKEETGYVILDVRTWEEFTEKHISGAINVPNETIGTQDIPELPDKEQRIFVYCRSGNRSKQASEKLVKLGYTNVVEFGGINSWPGETVSGDE